MKTAFDRQAIALACAVWAIHATLEMLIAEVFLPAALVWAAHGLLLMLGMGLLVSRCLQWPGRAARWASCAALVIAFTALQTAADLWVTLTLGDGLTNLAAPPGMVFSTTNLEFRIAAKVNFKFYIWLYGWFAVLLALLHAAREKWGARFEAQKAQMAATRAEIEALRLQINPHFLFNVFNTLDGLIADRKPEAAGRMLASLSNFYRTTLLDRDDALIALNEEFAALDDYMLIEQARFGDRLALDLNCPPDLGEAAVPPLILHPLVENAVKHGNDGRSDLIIHIDVRRRLDAIELTVSNAITEARAVPGSNTGLKNVQARLEALYGSRASLSAGARDGRWDCLLTLPFQRLPAAGG